MKTVITGGAGFIGSHLVDLLLTKDHHISIIDNFSTGRLSNLSHVENKVEICEADLSKNGDWELIVKEADYVFHLASLADIVPSIENPELYYHSNVTSTLNVLQACSKKVAKFIYAASSSCYGIPNKYPTPESCLIDPQYPYALTKYLGEEISMHWAKVYSLPVISTRFFNVFGTRSRTSGTYGAVFGVFLAQKLASRPLTIVGDGNQKRDFTYVTDVCKGLMLAAFSKYTHQIFNIGSGEPQSINYLAKLIGGDVTYIPKRPGEPDCTHADISKAIAMLSYSPSISFELGVKLVLEDIDYWSEAPVWTPNSIQEATKSWFKHLKGYNESIK